MTGDMIPRLESLTLLAKSKGIERKRMLRRIKAMEVLFGRRLLVRTGGETRGKWFVLVDELESVHQFIVASNDNSKAIGDLDDRVTAIELAIGTRAA